MFLRVNDASLNRHICKYWLPIWSHYTMCQATKFRKVEQPSQLPYLLYTNLYGGPRFLTFGTPRGLFQSFPPAPCIYIYIYNVCVCVYRIHIYDHICRSSFRTNCQMYNKPATQRSGLPYNISSSERVKHDIWFLTWNFWVLDTCVLLPSQIWSA